MREGSAPLPREEGSERLVPSVPSRARHLPTPGSALSQSSRAFGNRLQWFFGGDRRRPLPPPLRLVTGLGLLAVVGTLVLMLPGIGRGDPLSWNEALFTAMSALSVTGLSTIVVAEDLTLLGQIVLLILIQIGGVGFMVLAVVVFQLIGRRISLLNRLALCNSLGLIDPGAILELTRRVLLGVTLIELGGLCCSGCTGGISMGRGGQFFWLFFTRCRPFVMQDLTCLAGKGSLQTVCRWRFWPV